MDDLTKSNRQIVIYTLIVAILCGLGAIPFLGLSIPYIFGLALGTCVGIVCYIILTLISKKVIEGKHAWLAPAAYFIRMPLYFLAFFLSYTLKGFTAGVGCILGFLTVQAAIIYVHGIRAMFLKAKETEQDDDNQSPPPNSH